MSPSLARLSVLAAVAALGLAGCDQLASGGEAASADRPNLASSEDKGDRAIISATPQASLSPEERAEFRADIKEMLDTASARLAEEGYTPATGFEDEVVTLQPTQTHEYTLTLAAGADYRILGGCDGDCSDVDLELRNAAGQMIESDTLADDFPLLNVNVPTAGDYKLRIIMKACRIAPCYAGSRVYQRG